MTTYRPRTGEKLALTPDGVIGRKKMIYFVELAEIVALLWAKAYLNAISARVSTNISG